MKYKYTHTIDEEFKDYSKKCQHDMSLENVICALRLVLDEDGKRVSIKVAHQIVTDFLIDELDSSIEDN
jgi:hypothetical protein